MLNSLQREFQFFPTTLGFWDFWGSVGTFRFIQGVSNFQKWGHSGFQILVAGRKLHLW